MGQSKTKSIDGVEIVCVPLDEFPGGAEMFLTLSYVAMPALTELGAKIAGKIDLTKLAGADLDVKQLAAIAAVALGDDGAGKLFGAFEGSMRRLLREDVTLFRRLSGELLSGCRAVVPAGEGRVAAIDLNTPAKIQQAIAASGGGLLFFFKVLWFALGVNFGGPFADAFAGISKGSGSKTDSPPASTTPTA